MSEVVDRPQFGALLRDWRRRRRLSQLDLAYAAGVSPRHLSFIETGRSRPSAAMVIQLAEELDMPLRDRNSLLLAAGHAPAYGQHGLEEPQMEPVRGALDHLLAGHEPYPAVVVDRHWGLVAANRAVPLLIAGADPGLLAPPVNVLRLTLHPDGLAPRIRNLAEWRTHLLDRLHRQALASGDPALHALHAELLDHPSPTPDAVPDLDAGTVAVPLRIEVEGAELSFISAATTFGTAVDVTLSELAIETFLPTDERTRAFLRERIR
jgi:transcriptional regulator with XRE-family HTH domain